MNNIFLETSVGEQPIFPFPFLEAFRDVEAEGDSIRIFLEDESQTKLIGYFDYLRIFWVYLAVAVASVIIKLLRAAREEITREEALDQLRKEFKPPSRQTFKVEN